MASSGPLGAPTRCPRMDDVVMPAGRHIAAFALSALFVAASCGGHGTGAQPAGKGGAGGGTTTGISGSGGGAMPGGRGGEAGWAQDGGSPDAAVPTGGGGATTACTPDLAGRIPPAPLRRLTNFEYGNTLRDLVGVSLAAGDLPPAGDTVDPDAGGLALLTEAYHNLAHGFALAATKDAASVQAVAPCDMLAAGEAACAKKFIAAFVASAFRRPLDAEDAADFADVFAKGRVLGGDYASGVRAVIEVALQSPELLYRVELGEPVDPAQPGLGRPRPYEMAARLSYLLRGSPPDGLLLQAAGSDQLRTKAQIETQARRLLADPRAHDVTRQFYVQLLGLGDLLTSQPRLGALRPDLAVQETTRFVDEVIWGDAGNLKTLLTAPFSFVNDVLAQSYGIPGVSGSALQRATVPAGQRRGVLTQLSVLASTSPDLTHPSARGALIARQLLCADVPSPPNVATHVQVAMQPGETRRQWLERVAGPSACRACHAQMDPIGFAFEHYDARGSWRDSDGGLSIDAHGAIAGIDTAGSFDDALGLIDRLAGSRDVGNCHVGKWMESAYGRPLVASDACSRAGLEQAFASTGGNVRELMIGLTQSEAFLYRPVP
jgi:hypothetical protein